MEFLHDYAGVIDPQDEEAIGKLQKAAFEQYDTPIVVVTISNMKRYGGLPAGGATEMKRFAFSWFNKWQIGKRGAEGELIRK